MKIAKIVFTGADDKTDPAQLRSISDDFPQVEWGILFSKNKGHARYPKWNWVEALIRDHLGMPLAAHLCGQYVRDLLSGNFQIMDQSWAEAFRRFQVNFHGIKVTDDQAEAFLTKLVFHDKDHEWLLQMDGVNDQLYWAAKVQSIRVFPFFDLSGGDGVLPEKWHTPLGDFCGYAGGLGPHNLQEQLKKLEVVVGDDPIWIDFETHVRNEKDEFDLERVRRCIEIAEPYLLGDK
jgi:hypothetical protein